MIPPVPIPASIDRAHTLMADLVDSWCDRHDGGIAALDQASACVRDSWRQMGIDLTDPAVASAVAVALDGFVRCVFSDAHLAVSAIRARAYVTPLAAVLIDTLDKETCPVTGARLEVAVADKLDLPKWAVEEIPEIPT